MADIMSETTNKARLPEGAFKNAPPTPPDTQVDGNVKPHEPSNTLPPIVSEPLKSAEAPVVAPAIPSGAGPVPLGEVPPSAAVDIPKPAAPVEEVQKKIAEAEKTGAQPEKLGDLPSTDAQPVNAVPAAAQDGDAKEQPKPVSVEDVQDAELPGAKFGVAEKAVPTKDTVMPDVPPAAETAKTATTTDPAAAEPPATQQAEESNQIPAPTAPAVLKAAAEASAPLAAEPKVGEKRDADAALAPGADTNGDTTAPPTGAVLDLETPVEKKQKTEESADANGAAAGTVKRAKSKREKKPVAPVGRTARKTRSQGAAEADAA